MQSETSRMDRVQELIDEHRDQMPTGLAKTLLDACMEERNATALYKIKLTHVTSIPYCDEHEGPSARLLSSTQTRIVECVNDQTVCAIDLLDKGQVRKSWLSSAQTYPFVYHRRQEEVYIFHSFEPYLKRRH